MIKKENGKYVVYSEKGRKFGSYDTEKEAKKRLAQMEMFKRLKKEAGIKIPKFNKTQLNNIYNNTKNILKDPKTFDKLLTTILVAAHAQGPEIEAWKQGINHTLDLVKTVAKNPKAFVNTLKEQSKLLKAKTKLNNKNINNTIIDNKDVKQILAKMKHEHGVKI